MDFDFTNIIQIGQTSPTNSQQDLDRQMTSLCSLRAEEFRLEATIPPPLPTINTTFNKEPHGSSAFTSVPLPEEETRATVTLQTMQM